MLKTRVVVFLFLMASVVCAEQVCLWHFDNSYADAVGNGTANPWPGYGEFVSDDPNVAVGTHSWAALHVGGSAQIKLSLPSDKSIDGASTFGLAMWVKPMATYAYRRLWSFGVGLCQLQTYDALPAGGNARYGLKVGSLATMPSWWSQNIRLYEGVWQHIAVTADGTKVRVFINNVQKLEVAQTGTLTASDNLYLGVQADDRDHHPAYFDEVVMVNDPVGANWVNYVYTTTIDGTNLSALRTCQEINDAGLGNPADVNEDCYVDLNDFAGMLEYWMHCNSPSDPNCSSVWY